MLTTKSTQPSNLGQFAAITNGSIVIKSDATNTNAVKRVNKLGNTVFELIYAKCYGIITNVQIVNGKFGQDLIVSMSDGNQNMNLTMKADSSYARSFWKQFFNIDLTQGVEFAPFQFTGENDKTVIGISLKQNGDKVLKALPTGCPLVTGQEVKGKWVFDAIAQAKQDEFFENELAEIAKTQSWTRTILDFDAKKDGATVKTTSLPKAEQKDIKAELAQMKKAAKAESRGQDSDIDFFADDFNA